MTTIYELELEDMAVIAHCCNNFMRALEALKQEHESYIELEDVMHLVGHCPVCALIKELEEVK